MPKREFQWRIEGEGVASWPLPDLFLENLEFVPDRIGQKCLFIKKGAFLLNFI